MQDGLLKSERSGKQIFFRSLLLPGIFLLLLWIIELAQEFSGSRIWSMGIIPRKLDGLTGIFTAPFLHAGIDHLLSNTLPLLIVGAGLIYFYPTLALRVTIMVWLFGGIWVWLSGRDSSHIGASGLLYGFVVFLFFSGLMRKDTRLIAISLLVTFLYGSLVWGILPVDQSVSWESHLFGALAGFICAVYYRKDGPQKPKAQWEIDEEYELLHPEIQDESDMISSSAESSNEQKPDSTPVQIRYIFKPDADEKQADKGF
ncbi:MAG: rhomboid family intramembrane serine protease [Bacteroidetes bacterium]|nr:MAG: rhomboid family intramembrane serine protease [Bacteroidota bacterium]